MMDAYHYRLKLFYAAAVLLSADRERARSRRRRRTSYAAAALLSADRESPLSRRRRRRSYAAAVRLSSDRESLWSRRRRRSCWTRQWLLRRETRPPLPLLMEIPENNPDDYRDFLRMDDATFQELLSLVTPYIQRRDTSTRRAIPAEDKLVVTLKFLATGRSLVSPQSLGLLIPETCKAIVAALKQQHFKFPSSAEEWTSVAAEFERRWDFPNCGGAIGGKHVRITPPANTGSYYYNYKGFFSIVLMAVVNANYQFLFVDVGKNGRGSDGGSFKQTAFYERLMNNRLNLPSAEETKHGLDFVFVADEAFALHEQIMEPYVQRGLTKEKCVFNDRLSRAQRVGDNAFKMLSNRFRIFHTPINLHVDKIDWVVLACCVLHNFLQQRTASRAMPDHPGDMDRWSSVESSGVVPTASACSKQVREEYLNYFNGVGAAPGQEGCIDISCKPLLSPM